MPYCTKGDLELSVGGSAVLVRLLDKDRDGVADDRLVQACLSRASSEVDSALQIRHQLPLTETPPILVTHASNLAAYYAHQMGTDGQAVPQGIRQAAEDARGFLSDLAEGRRTVGTPAKPASDHVVKQVDTNPDGGWVTRDSLKGFW